MLVHSIYTNNSFRNFHYLLVDEETKKAIAVDPFEAKQVAEEALKNNWTITSIINTHEHGDHINGNQALMSMAPIEHVYSHPQARQKINTQTDDLPLNDTITIENHKIKVLDTPGHTYTHVCLFIPGSQTSPPKLISGDTLFSAGVGNCHSGDAKLLYKSITNEISCLPDDTIIYPGHEYAENNLKFSLHVEPDNIATQKYLAKIKKSPNYFKNNHITLGIEKQINPFLRLNQKTIHQHIINNYNQSSNSLSELEVFLKLRQERNNW